MWMWIGIFEMMMTCFYRVVLDADPDPHPGHVHAVANCHSHVHYHVHVHCRCHCVDDDTHNKVGKDVEPVDEIPLISHSSVSVC